MDYPIVKIPPVICDWLEREKIASSKPRKINRKKSKNKVYFLGFVSGVLVVLLIKFLISLEWNITALIIFLIALSGSFLSAFLFLRLVDFDSPREFEDDERAIALITSLRKRYLKRPLSQKLRKVLKGKVKPLESLTPSATQGVSEGFFLSSLKQYFGDKVNFPDGVFTIKGNFYEYTPDIVYRDPETDLTIDIEIDEPYAGNTKEPHHCNDDGRDRRRDDFFLERNWVVIRFAEEQVVKYPVACAYHLDKVIYRLSGLRHDVPAEKLPPIPTWDSLESTSMARLLHRETYLKEHGLWQ